MSLLEKLPKEIKKDEFDGFIKKIKSDLPVSLFPEIFIHYQQVDDKISILGIGSNRKCAQQALRAYKENPELRKHESMTQILRAPKKRFLLR